MANAKRCRLCGKNGAGDPLERHHVFFGRGKRKLSEQYGAVVWLCGNECHRNGRYAVHKNRYVDLALKEQYQRKIMAEQGWNIQDFIKVFGKNYI